MTDIDPATRRAARALGERLASAARDDSLRRASFTDVGTIEEVMTDGTALVSYRGGTIGPLPMTCDCVCAARGRSCVIAIDGPIVRVIGVIARSPTDFELPASCVTGTLPVSHGGTGATTAAGARSALGVREWWGSIPESSSKTSYTKLGTWSGSSDKTNLEIRAYVSDPQGRMIDAYVFNCWQSSKSATGAFGCNYSTTNGGAESPVIVRATAHDVCEVWMQHNAAYQNGNYFARWTSGTWAPADSTTTTAPSSGVLQASSLVPGGFKAGSGLSFSDGTLSVDNGAYVKLYSEGTDGYCAYRRCGCLVSVVCDYLSSTAKTIKKLGTLPVGCRPKMSILGMAYPRGTNSCGQITVDPNGTVNLYTFEGSSGYVGGSVTFPLP